MLHVVFCVLTITRFTSPPVDSILNSVFLVLCASREAACLFLLTLQRGTSDKSENEILASAGESVLLPCQISTSIQNPTVEWTKVGQKTKFIFVYRDGCETFEMKDQEFQFRTSLIMSEVKNGNISLRISNVRPSDAGKYNCRVFHRSQSGVVRTLELIVCAPLQPKLSVVAGDMETLQCEVNSSLPQLQMTFLDHQEKDINAQEVPKRRQDSRGCWTITWRVTVPNASERVTCRVLQPHTNQFTDAQIYFTAKSTMTCTVLCSVVAAVAVVFGLIYISYKIYSNRVRGKQRLEPNQPLVLKTDAQTYHVVKQSESSNPDVSSEHQIKIRELESELQEQQSIISQLREELSLRSKQSPVPCHLNQPTLDLSPPKSNSINPHQFPNGNNPNPLATSNDNHLKSVSFQKKAKKPGSGRQTAVGRFSSGVTTRPESADSSRKSVSEEKPSKRLSESRSHSKATKPQRRHTYSAVTPNRYDVLADTSLD
ncbi:butyrophilin subfamily 1 member A1-like isoform X2 [Paralichthys olivaceus]|uniref:butyrophilin subfamily 1 member A1-like isoform X2 n=1 Tax=Paralichthys olivaceus TaxID=8255 RepID=UPI003753D13B